MRVPVDSHKSVNLNALVPEQVMSRLESTANQEGRRLPEVVREILEIGLDSYNGQEVRRAA